MIKMTEGQNILQGHHTDNESRENPYNLERELQLLASGRHILESLEFKHSATYFRLVVLGTL
jgi:hypothetical protein